MSTTQLAILNEVTGIATTQVREYLKAGSLQLPTNYSVENALKSAALMLPEIKDSNKVPVLQSCTKESIMNSLKSMCVQGLNPDKKQCYFIAYGEKLTLSRSYLGDIYLAKQVDPNIEEIYSAVVFKDDKFDYDIKRGKIVEIRHSQKLENKDKPIVAAYATIVYKDGSEISTVSSFEQIKKAWGQSSMKPVNTDGTIKADTTHAKFAEEMAKKTVVHKACKPIIDTSNDSNLMYRYAKQSSDDMAAAEVEQEISENANKQMIDVECIDKETGEYTEPEDAPQKAREPF